MHPHSALRIELCILLAGFMSGSAALAAPEPPQIAVCPPSPCTVVGGKFERRWGGHIQNAYAHDPTPSIAWVLEDGGRIRRTTNGGSNWADQETPPCVQNVLRSASFLGAVPRRGFAVGDNGWVLKTTDGGGHWDTVSQHFYPDTTGSPAELWDVFFIDQNVGWIAGNHLIRKTTDGGCTWQDAQLVASGGASINMGEFYSMQFAVSGTQFVGLAAGEPGWIARTTDAMNGGLDWQLTFDLCSLGIGWLCSPCTGPECDEFEIWDVEFFPTSSPYTAEALAVGGFGNQCGQILHGINGGASWTQEFSSCDPCIASTCPCDGFRPPTLYGVTTYADKRAVASGYGATLYERNIGCTPPVWDLTDGLVSPVTITIPLLGVDGNGAGGGAGIAFAVGGFGSIGKSTDSGATWTVQQGDVVQPSGQHMRIGDCFFKDASVGWVAGQRLRVSKSTDGGRTFVEKSLVPASGLSLSSIEFNTAVTRGVAVGAPDPNGFAKILESHDGSGEVWSDAAVSPAGVTAGKHLNDAAYAGQDGQGNDHFWAVGNDGFVLHSSNGGALFTQVAMTGVPTSGLVLRGVGFFNLDDGLVVGYRGSSAAVYRVENATTTPSWTPVLIDAAVSAVSLENVAASGTRANAVGRKSVAGGEKALVLQWNGTGLVEAAVPELSYCKAEALIGYLWDVEFVPGSNEIYAAGDCGRMLWFNGTAWQEVKSGTSKPITGMSFVSPTVGFLVGGNDAEPGGGTSVIMALKP